MREIKVKSVEYHGLGLAIVVEYLVFGIMSLVIVLTSESIDWLLILVAVLFALLPTPLLVGHLLAIRFCKTYDIYSEWGVKRMHKEKVIFEVPWSKVLKVSYTWEIPYIYPARLVVKLCSDEFEGNFPDGGGDDFFCTTMNKKTLSAITELLPPNLKEGVNFIDKTSKSK